MLLHLPRSANADAAANISMHFASPPTLPSLRENSQREAATFPYLLQTIFRIHKSQLKEDKSRVIQPVWQRGYERAQGREITQNYEAQSLDLPPMLEQNDCRPNYKRLHHSRVQAKNELWKLPVRRTRTTLAQTVRYPLSRVLRPPD